MLPIYHLIVERNTELYKNYFEICDTWMYPFTDSFKRASDCWRYIQPLLISAFLLRRISLRNNPQRWLNNLVLNYRQCIEPFLKVYLTPLVQQFIQNSNEAANYESKFRSIHVKVTKYSGLYFEPICCVFLSFFLFLSFKWDCIHPVILISSNCNKKSIFTLEIIKVKN